MADFTLPELGENVTAGDVLRVLVKPGDTIARDQPVLELETDKATIEVPSSLAGRVTSVEVQTGDTVKVGQVVMRVEDGSAAAEATDTPPQPAAKPAEPAPAPETAEEAAARVPDGGLEQHVEGSSRQARPGGRSESSAEAPVESTDAEARESGRAGARARKVVDISRGARPSPERAHADAPASPAAPSVRRMARELGVDIQDVPGSGSRGRISAEDVKTYAKRVIESAGAAPGGAAPVSAPLPDFSRYGEIERRPMHAVRRKTAEHLGAAWRTVPHVTQHDLADVTALEGLRKKYAKETEAAGGTLTLTAIVTKVAASALKAFPQFNASIDLAAQEIVYKKYVNIGIAVDTDRGLLVPVVRDADRKNIIQLAVEISDLSARARARKLTLEEMQGGCFSISNLGGIGGTYFTPIVNAPELAILGVGRARMEPVYVEPPSGSTGDDEPGRFEPRLMLPLSLSYDHRAIDGADGIRFLRWLVQALEQPFLLALQG